MNESSGNPRVRFDFRTFSILIVIAVVPMLIVTWYLFSSHEEYYLEITGSDLSDTAETAFSLINSYLQNQIITVAGLSESPVLRAAVAAGNQDLKKNLEEVRKAIPKMADAWPNLGPETPQAKSILDNAASQFLRRYTNVNRSYRDIIVTDFFGRLVATTGKNTGYYYAHEDWWKETYGDGRRGSVYIGNLRHEPASKSYLMDIAQPFVMPDMGVIGVLKIVLDLQSIHSLLGSIQAGPGRSVALIHAKGDVISAPGYSSLQLTTYPETLAILTAREKEKAYFLSSGADPAIYGMTRKSFTDLYPHLNWIVFATGKVSDLKGRLPLLRKYFMAMLVGTFLLAGIATLMLSRVESKPVLEEDPHLEKL